MESMRNLRATRFLAEASLALPRGLRCGMAPGSGKTAPDLFKHLGAGSRSQPPLARRQAQYHQVPRSQWQLVIPGVHVGYISWEQFEANQK